MSALTGDTEVFTHGEASGRCVVMFLSRRQDEWRRHCSDATAASLADTLTALGAEGWRLSIRGMFDPRDSKPTALDTGFAHDVDMAGVFEAPSLTAAVAGTVRLERAGWERYFATEWLIGPREFATVNGAGGAHSRPWGFLALWEWNDAWAAATPATRAEYDLECDVAFKGDLALGINIAGRHRLDWAHSWHHLGAWEAASPEAIDKAITGHEHARDFMFTTSRHLVGPVRPITHFLQAS